MVQCWRRDQATILSGKLKMSEIRAKIGSLLQVSQTSQASDGVLFTAERPHISFIM